MLLARIISRSFNPLLVGVYFLLITLNFASEDVMSIPLKAKLMVIGMAMVTSYIVPALLISSFGTLFKQPLSLSGREEKIAKLFIAAIFYLLTYYLFNKIQFFPIYSWFLLGVATLTGLTILISIFWNISIYMAATGACMGALLGLMFTTNFDLLIQILIITAISGLAGYSKLMLDEHRPAEVYAGFLLGTVGMFLYFLFL